MNRLEYILILILVLIIIFLSVFLIVSINKKSSDASDADGMFSTCSDESTSLPDIVTEEDCFTIPNLKLPANTQLDENRLFEITDSIVISSISETIPHAANSLAKTINKHALKKVDIYKAIIPGGTKLVDSKQMGNAVRGIYRDAKGIGGHANLIKVDPTKISRVSRVANGVVNVMNVGSLVVGQYYMSEVNNKLEALNDSMSKISDFQQKEFKSRILSLIDRVVLISEFSSEILENDEMRKIKLHTIEDLEGEATQLLQQVNLTINDIAMNNAITDFKNTKLKWTTSVFY